MSANPDAQGLPSSANPGESSPDAARRAWLVRAGAVALAPLLPACGGGSDGPRFFPPPPAPPAPPPSPDAAAIDWGREAIRAAMQKADTPAVTIALSRDGEVVWQEAFGVIDRESGQAATPQTHVNIGSVSKVIAALATMVLVDRRLVDLDAPVVRYLPEFRMLSPAYRHISARHLLSHSSGLPGTYSRNIFAFKPLPGYSAAAEAALADRHLKHEPGEMAMYCNDGFTMIERLVLAVTGQEYPAFVQAAILDPLEMSESSFALAPLPEGSYAHPYVDGRRQGQEFVMAYATGGLRSTSGDMMKLAAMFLDGGAYKGRRVVSEAGIAAMAQDQTRDLRINPSPEWRWGLGWDNVRQLGLDAVGVQAWQKNGGTSFYATDFFVLPQARMALFISGSGHGYEPGVLAEGILLRALRGSGRIDSLPQSLPSTPPAQAAQPSADEVRAVLGIYASHITPLRVVPADGGGVDLLQGGAQGDGSFGWTPFVAGLRLRVDGWWWSEVAPGSSYRWVVEGGHRYLMTRRPGGQGHYPITLPIGQQMPPAPGPLPEVWARRLDGRWAVADEDPSSTALIEDIAPARLRELAELPGYLFWDEPGMGRQQFLLPLADQRAGMTVQVPVNHGRDLIELVVQARDGQEWLNVGGSLYRPVPAA